MNIDEKEHEDIESGSERDAAPDRQERETHPRDKAAGKEPGRDLKSIIKAAADSHRGKEYDDEGNLLRDHGKKPERAKDGKFTPTDKSEGDAKVEAKADKAVPAPEAHKEIPSTKVAEDAKPETPAQAVQVPAAPAALSKEVKAQWETLPDSVRAEFIRREEDTRKGVEKLQSHYRQYDEAFAPVEQQLQALGKTKPEAIRQMLNWHTSLSNPQTQAQAFVALARAHNFDLSTIAPRAIAPTNDGSQQSQPFDPNQIVRPYIEPVMQEVTSLKSELQRRDAERVQADINSFAKDKPHFERVRQAMGHMINAGMVPGANPKEVFDEAYLRACRQDPEIFAQMQQEEIAQREAAQKAAAEEAARKATAEAEERKRKEREEVERARKAAVGPKGSSPAGVKIVGARRGESVRETIKNAARNAGAQL